MIGVLRDETPGALVPRPTLAALDGLLAESRAAGMDLVVERSGVDPASVPTETGLHAYRVVREGLTNARKHAPGCPVRLTITGAPASYLRIEVENPVAAPARDTSGADRGPGDRRNGDRTGRPAGARLPRDAEVGSAVPQGRAVDGAGIPGTGTGLVGLRERVAVAGGTLTHGLDEDGRHRLVARLPWPA